jgi:formate dehydrogenase assembly factor FdhD
MLDGLMAAHMVAVIERDGQRDEVVVEEPMEIRVNGRALAGFARGSTVNVYTRLERVG